MTWSKFQYEDPHTHIRCHGTELSRLWFVHLAVSKLYSALLTVSLRNEKISEEQAKTYINIQINQPTRYNSFTSLLLDVFVWLNMFLTPLRPSSGEYNCTRSGWSVVGHGLVSLQDHDQQRSNRHAPTVKTEAPSAVVRSWWWAERRPKHVEPHKNVK